METFNWIDNHVKERFNSNFHLDKADAPTRVYIMALCAFLDYQFYGLGKGIASQPPVEADAEGSCGFCMTAKGRNFNYCDMCGRKLRTT